MACLSSIAAADERPPKMTDEEKIEWYCAKPENAGETCAVNAAALLPYISDYAKYPDLDVRGEPMPETRPCEWTGSCPRDDARPPASPPAPAAPATNGGPGLSAAQLAKCPNIASLRAPEDQGRSGLLNMRFNLPPGTVGAVAFSYPGDFKTKVVNVSAVGATFQETPRGTTALLAVSRCPGGLDVPADCKSMAGPVGVLAVGEGTKCPLAPGIWFVSVAHRKPAPANQSSCTDQFGLGYCTTWLKVN